MNTINYIQGNIIDAWENNEINALAHQCNCVTRQVSGFARALFIKFPKFSEHHFTYIENNPSCFNTIYYEIENNKALINIYSQYYPSGPNNLFFVRNGIYYVDDFETRCDALKNCFKTIFENVILENQGLNLGIPLIASGLAADRNLKNNMTDLEYFVVHIEPILKNIELNNNFKINVYYL